jgi:hypothetical protein
LNFAEMYCRYLERDDFDNAEYSDGSTSKLDPSEPCNRMSTECRLGVTESPSSNDLVIMIYQKHHNTRKARKLSIELFKTPVTFQQVLSARYESESPPKGKLTIDFPGGHPRRQIKSGFRPVITIQETPALVYEKPKCEISSQTDAVLEVGHIDSLIEVFTRPKWLSRSTKNY